MLTIVTFVCVWLSRLHSMANTMCVCLCLCPCTFTRINMVFHICLNTMLNQYAGGRRTCFICSCIVFGRPKLHSGLLQSIACPLAQGVVCGRDQFAYARRSVTYLGNQPSSNTSLCIYIYIYIYFSLSFSPSLFIYNVYLHISRLLRQGICIACHPYR